MYDSIYKQFRDSQKQSMRTELEQKRLPWEGGSGVYCLEEGKREPVKGLRNILHLDVGSGSIELNICAFYCASAKVKAKKAKQQKEKKKVQEGR